MRRLLLSAFLGALLISGPLRTALAQAPSPDAPHPEVRSGGRFWTTDIDPNLYVNSLDTTVAYDDLLNQRDYDDGYEVDAYRPFEATLSPHGTWSDTATLGRVWFPSAGEVGLGFVPYSTGGHWARTEYGWTWISDWRWGWAPFHYGRWAVLPGRGWCWIPGTIWSPAWVAWRVGRNYIAWAPLPPEGMSIGRPLGPRSPWSMTRIQTFGTPRQDAVPRRVLPSLFARTTAFSNPVPITFGRYSAEINAGPTRLRCCRDRPVRRLAEIAPDVVPKTTIHPYSGVALESRPWVQRHFSEQTPLCPWPADGTRDAGPCVLSASASSPDNNPR